MLGLHSVKQREQECPQNRTSLKNDGDGEPPELLPHRMGGVAGATGLGRFRPWGRPVPRWAVCLLASPPSPASHASTQPAANEHMAASQDFLTAHEDQETAIYSHKQANKNPTWEVSNRANLHARPSGASLEPQRPPQGQPESSGLPGCSISRHLTFKTLSYEPPFCSNWLKLLCFI